VIASELGQVGVASVAPTCSRFTYRVGKRCLDMVIAAIALTILLPVLTLIGLAVWLSSPGGSVYCWRVVGLGGRPFVSYKFRTMIPDADRMRAALRARNEMTGPVLKLRDDPRITPVGRFLRRWSLDELPQLWSVLKGDMSLVGPRPPLMDEYEQFEPWQRRKLSVKPGLTCLWQVRGRNQISDFDEWVRLDLAYIDNWSLWLDIKILAQTIPAVLSRRGAY
jgi:lipopolysaccharide/colanic/teichoic acid biosynthesis glycosyltransferase